MGSIAQLVLIKSLKCRNDVGHPGDGADTKIPTAAVRSAALRRDLHPNKTFMSKDEFSLAGLGHDTSIGFVAFHEILCTDARVFLVRDQRDQYASSNIRSRERSCG